jgi:hypothetical protein
MKGEAGSKLITETKRWGTDIHEWGTTEGTKEAIITGVEILNKNGLKIEKLIPGETAAIKVYFTVQEEIDNVHFGVAIFREDGVYCYGPNSKIDGFFVHHLSKGKGYFEIIYKEVLLMPGIYYLSVAIWDANEKFAYDYHKGFYKIEISGTPVFDQLAYFPGERTGGIFRGLFRAKGPGPEEKSPSLVFLADKWNTSLENDLAGIDSIKVKHINGAEDNIFKTGQDMEAEVSIKISQGCPVKYPALWLGVYRSDGVYCHGSARKVKAGQETSAVFPYRSLKFLPGGYRLSAGIFDAEKGNFIVYSHGRHLFRVASERPDHGTIYMAHSWRWRMVKGG